MLPARCCAPPPALLAKSLFWDSPLRTSPELVAQSPPGDVSRQSRWTCVAAVSAGLSSSEWLLRAIGPLCSQVGSLCSALAAPPHPRRSGWCFPGTDLLIWEVWLGGVHVVRR